MKLFLQVLFLLIPTLLVAQQAVTVSGTVSEAPTGEGIPGVNVVEKGTTNGTITDIDGNYTITVSESSATLVFSFVGMQSQEISVDGRTRIDVQMKQDIIGLEEVVAVGYGTVRKSDLTGSVTSIKSEEIRKVPVTSLDQSMQGRVSGVNVVQLNAQPGGATKIRIRGGNSILGSNEPLYVIDGMPIENRNNLSWLSSPVQNALGSLNPNDIESIEILKDASATSIYGARGANGVVLITTKRGFSGKDRISFEAYYSYQEVAKRLEVMNATQYAILFDEAGQNAAEDEGVNYTPVYPDPESLGEGTNWQDEIYRVSPTQNYQLSFSGGDDRTRYAVTGHYYSQDGIIYGSDFKRYSGRANVDRTVSENFNIGANLSFAHTEANTVGSSTQGGFFPGVVNTSLTFSPVLPVYDSTGNYTITDPNANAWLDNPVAVTREVDAIDKTNRFLGNVFAEYEFIRNLELRVSLGVDHNHNTQDYYNPSFTYSGSFGGGQARFAVTQFTTLVNENILSYSKNFNERHDLSLMGGFTFQTFNDRSYIDVSNNFANDKLGFYGIVNAEDRPNIYTGFSEEAIISYLGRINYSLDQKYLLTLNARVDGSSKFGPENRYGFFPSIALAWRVSQEDLLKDLDYLHNLKLRASFGYSGNDKIGNYLFIPTMATSLYYFNRTVPTTGYYPERIGNDMLKWETTRQLDVGLDLAFFEGRISLVTDYYHKLTFDMLYNSQIPYTSGYANATINVGEMVNRGYEFNLTTANLVGTFSWNTTFNIAFNKTIVLDLKGNDDTFISNDEYKLKIGNWSVISEGEEMNSFYGLEADGIWQLDEAGEAAVYGVYPGDFKYMDQNDDGQINAADRKIIGQAQPDFIFSLNNTFSYKNFELTAFFQGVYGNEILNANRFELESGNGLSNASIEMLDRWTPENPSNTYPRANRNSDYLRMSDRYLEDGSYLRLQVLTLAYNLPTSLVQRVGLSSARVYISGKNLLTLTNYTGFDPEVGRFGQDNTRQGYDYGGYPAARVYLLGVNLDF